MRLQRSLDTKSNQGWHFASPAWIARWLHRLAFTGVIAGAGGAAMANDFPAYDVAASCKVQIAKKAYPDSGYGNCIAAEQQALQALVASYHAISDAVASACEARAVKVTNGRGSYVVLQQCLGPSPQ